MGWCGYSHLKVWISSQGEVISAMTPPPPSSQGEVISAMGRVHLECAKVLKMCLFNTSHTKSLRLDEFEQGQTQNIDQVGNYLKVRRG